MVSLNCEDLFPVVCACGFAINLEQPCKFVTVTKVQENAPRRKCFAFRTKMTLQV